jgi:hypothetical protein
MQCIVVDGASQCILILKSTMLELCDIDTINTTKKVLSTMFASQERSQEKVDCPDSSFLQQLILLNLPAKQFVFI